MSETTTAKGTFEVHMKPQQDEGNPVSRMLLDKSYAGDLQASALGQMLAVRTEVEGSAAYVALEVVKGTLGGKAGSFALQHRGTMNRGASELFLEVVPDSGTEGLEGLRGQMRIIIEDGQHHYELDWSLAE